MEAWMVVLICMILACYTAYSIADNLSTKILARLTVANFTFRLREDGRRQLSQQKARVNELED